MRNLEIKLLLPYNWYHARRIRVYDDSGKLLVKIAHCEHVLVQVEETCKAVTIRIDYIKSVIEIPEAGNRDLFLGIYMDFRDRFPIKYYDILKRKCVTGRFMDADEFDNYSLNIYDQSKNFLPLKKFNKQTFFTGLAISAGLVIASVTQQENPDQDIVFFIGVSSFISLLIMNAAKETLQKFDYKSRLIATAAAFVLAFIFLQHSFAVTVLFLLFILSYSLQVWANVKSLNTA